MTEFQAWPKIPRLNRNCIVTEKIDGTNAAVVVEALTVSQELGMEPYASDDPSRPIAVVQTPDEQWFGVWAQSRKRLLLPNSAESKASDNFGFAAWVRDNALELASGLGEGRHFGEWWGQGIQRTYGLEEKRFSLFNSGRWHDQQANGIGSACAPGCCSVVPVLALGKVMESPWLTALDLLYVHGSAAAPGFTDPEGIVVYHTAARESFKVTFDQDELPKSVVTGVAEAFANAAASEAAV